MKLEITSPKYLVSLLDLITLKDIHELNLKYDMEVDIFKVYDGLKYIADKVNKGKHEIELDFRTLVDIELFIANQTLDDTIYLMNKHNLSTIDKHVVGNYDTALFEMYHSIFSHICNF